jgi:phosphate:Na+ symporter
MVGALLGGVGLFLLGMVLLTEGLQALAGDGLRNALRRHTGTRTQAILMGTAATALVQSSSATTLAVIGFVNAGLLKLGPAIGVVYGANLGTTATAWIVATVGLKIKIDTFALPLVGVGALTRLFTRGWRASVGIALAGFGLVFVGIGILQGGMQSAGDRLAPSAAMGHGALTILLLVMLGVVMTVVMQSSSAAVATTLAAVSAGTVTLTQAMALVVGQNVGTTVTALIGCIGGSAVARRTAWAHVIFNVGTGAVALGLLPLVGVVVPAAAAKEDPALVLAGFHSVFNLLGVLLFAPWTPQMASWLERRIVDSGAALTRRLTLRSKHIPSTVVEAARLTAADILAEALGVARRLLEGETKESILEARRDALQNALVAVREHLTSVQTDPGSATDYRRHVAVLHAVDHLHRLVEAYGESANRAAARNYDESAKLARELAAELVRARRWLQQPGSGPAPDLGLASRSVASARRALRPNLLERAAAGELDAEVIERRLEALRWVDRIGYHAWRAQHHLAAADQELEAELPPAPESRGRRGHESHGLS